ncbi:uncharacterized protein LOC122507246 [Leptopilina heterotoma]|uniref:uncharacterized protein LOC122507246 n=1 Tax=Leptopilina heterotoma TaxID=63436 RepID=UPI001CA8CC04|nr:uncharacterized protein LOC122507246 [Leptopilina heterotoma]
MLFTDESTFEIDGIWNTCNFHHWALQNPHLVSERGFLNRFKLNLFAGMIENKLIGPIIIQANMDGPKYKRLMKTIRQRLRDAGFTDQQIANKQQIWLQHDMTIM